MRDKKIKEAMHQYIEGQADEMISACQETPDFASLDEKVYEMLNAEQEKTSVIFSYKKIAAFAASLLFVIGLGITLSLFLKKDPNQSMQDTANLLIISYENEQYGYYSNQVLMDRYDMKVVPDTVSGYVRQEDILSIDSTINAEDIIGAEIHLFNEDVLIIRGRDGDYYLEKMKNK